MQIDSKNINNILVVRNDRFGEFLLNIPALRALKKTFSNSRIIAAVDPSVEGLAQSIPFIDETIEWGREKHTLPEKLRLINLLRSKDIDIAIMLNPCKDFNIFTYLAGIPVRVGYDRKWGFLLTHKIKDEKYLGKKHEIEYNLELVSLLGARTLDKSLSLTIDDRIINGLLKDAGIENYDNLVAIHPWTSDPIKQWPMDNFQELMRKLLKEPNLKLVVIGGPDELERSRQLFGNLGRGLINLTARTTLKQLAVLLKKCKLLISGDSGPVHLAACMETPVIVIFRSDMPQKCAVRWGPSSEGSIVVQKSNLADISVEEVLEKVRLRIR
jgi:ADP-heptose:LPS heptosyltransferase